MKQIRFVWAALFALILAACSGNGKKENQLQMVAQDSVAVHTPQRMQASDVTSTFTYKGKDYTSRVVRRPDEALPHVKDEQGDEFVDNSITVLLTDAGRKVLDRRFTKRDFAGLVDERFLKHSLLEGLVYDQTTPQGIVYAASVCYPQSDLYVPLRITVTPDGKVTMAKEERMNEE